MKSSNASLALIVAGALTCGLSLGCGDMGGAATTATAEASGSAKAAAAPGKSGAPASASGTPAAAATTAAAKVETPAAASGGTILKHMPKDCDEGRIYANVGKFLGPDAGGALDALMAKGMAGQKDGKKSEEVLKILKDGGIEPVKNIQEVAVCMTKDDSKMVVAFAFDMTKADKPADTIAKAIEAGDGKAPKKEEAGDITYLSEEGGKDVIAIIGKTVILIGKDRAAVEAAAKGGDGAGDFGDATSHVVWAKVSDKNTQVAMKESGSNFDLKIQADSKDAAKKKEEMEKMLPQLDTMVGQLPPDMQNLVKPLLPIAKNAKAEVQGESLVVTTNFPKTALSEFLTAAGQVKPEDLMKNLAKF